MIKRAASVLLALSCGALFAADADREWVTKSNEYGKTVLQIAAKYNPEGTGELGIDGYDEAILDLGPNLYERKRADTQQALAQLKDRLEREEHPKIRQDL